MSSHGGQQNFPFGCMAYTTLLFLYPTFPLSTDTLTYQSPPDQPENLHGIGLPEFITPGPPPGQPLLNAHENQDLDNFFQGFDQNAAAHKSLTHSHFNVPADHEQFFNMPPMFVGSDTALAQRAAIEPHQLSGGGFPYGNMLLGPDMNAVAPPQSLVGGMHGPSYTDPAFHNPFVAQLQSAASMQPAFTQSWQQSFPAHNMMNTQTQSRLGMGFGTDARFQPTGYAAPHNPMDPDLPQGLQMTNPLSEWLEPNSASTTQPNTQPNTQPSSPIWSKKRNFDDFARDQQPRNGFVVPAQNAGSARPSPPNSNSRRKRSVVKTEVRTPLSQPPTPLSNSKPHTPLEPEYPDPSETPEQDEDAEAEEEDEDSIQRPKSPSPAPWPGSRPRPPRNTKAPPPKPSRKRKASTSTPAKAKKSQATQKTTARTPLSLDQKKANHTNSEQRRRDATQRSYAELYDLVPELDDIGKQSTMKKLEVVVAKVRHTKERVEELRAKLGMDPAAGRPLGGGAGSGGSSMLLYSDVPGWRQ
ncbi:hypothetical protein H2200_001424 [Cladophialophora chaetospira]|uniref:BHLH domain-containing protein n=1 Tax=Cladophialophora chaetospira TaxID=386627 RepID=A0AA38XKV7_9EURO|nr:hypothetical protein H2200_001424 [Cladophialophora chaetospira]